MLKSNRGVVVGIGGSSHRSLIKALCSVIDEDKPVYLKVSVEEVNKYTSVTMKSRRRKHKKTK